ncbi:hypothetical protein [Hydrogenoanaerobacterium sp.]|uniref:hypothetical protein n=1 Tax=Hydrogenoanaerobacterium sp. TaxID=2953763 RepID=UPI0028A2165A|nr:hypothetical protein [Hydrogenoanaerobacterium sp.]
MAANEKENPSILPIEQLRKIYHTPDAVYAGVAAQKGWARGKCVSEAEYKAAVAKFLKSPMKEGG